MLGERLNVIRKAGSSYSFGEVKLGQGLDAAKKFLKENPKIVKEIRNALAKVSAA